jgi:copper chaperone CopZ
MNCILNAITIFTIALAAILTGCASSHSGAHPAASPGAFAGHAGPVVTFKVEGMACRNCANEIARELKDVPGVHGATIDFDSATARVALDPDPSKAPTMQSLHDAVEHWRKEHFSAAEDPNCLDPARRAELQQHAE